ncbi:MAG: hypothetical protein J6N76_09590, partial [Lachnospiraceae bacterium]|nr:hypothetical protein [Lachnospiraceae bacterium]
MTVDRYMSELRGFTNRTLYPFYERITDAKGVTKIRETLKYVPGETDLKAISEARKEMVKKFNEAVKRRDHLVNLCSVWINQAVFDQSSAFYHGDLHAGNIMIDDEK